MNNNQYLIRAKEAATNGQYLQAVSYADIAVYTSHTQEAKDLRQIFVNKYLTSLQTRHYNQNKVAVYAITKNEMKFVDKWYTSMSEADYIVVLDTGSTDGTYEHFQELAKADNRIIIAQQEFKPWRFDLPRNIAMSLVPEDANILLSTDLDEILEPGWYEDLTSHWIEGTHTRATYQYAWSHNQSGAPGRVFWYNKVHDWTWIWRFPVHELLYKLQTGSETYQHEHNVTLNKMYLHHYPDPTKSRGNYLPLLEQRAAEDVTDCYGLIYLSHEYCYRGYYQKSIETLNKALATIDFNSDRTLEASCYLFMGDDYKYLKDIDNAIHAYQKAIDIEPVYREPYLNLAEIYIGQHKYTEAIKIIKQAFISSVRQYSWLERDISWTYQPYDLLCLAYYYSGDKLKSLACAYKAAELEPADPRLKANIKSVLDTMTNEDW